MAHAMLVCADARAMGVVTATKSGLRPDAEGWIGRIMRDHAAERRNNGRKSVKRQGFGRFKSTPIIPLKAQTRAEGIAERISEMTDEQAARFLAQLVW